MAGNCLEHRSDRRAHAFARPVMELAPGRKDRETLQIGHVLCDLGGRAQPVDARRKGLIIAAIGGNEEDDARRLVGAPQARLPAGAQPLRCQFIVGVECQISAADLASRKTERKREPALFHGHALAFELGREPAHCFGRELAGKPAQQKRHDRCRFGTGRVTRIHFRSPSPRRQVPAIYRCSRTVAAKPASASRAGALAPALAISAASTSETPAMSAATARETAPGAGRRARR